MPWPKVWAWQKGTTIAMMEQIPAEYLRHAKVFDKEEANRFPPKQEEDHVINLKEDALAVLDCKIYPLPHDQNIKLDEFLAEHLRKGYI